MDHAAHAAAGAAAHGAHDPTLVALSLVLAAIGSFAALELADRATGEVGARRVRWLAGAAAAMGGGIWAMHFTAMLAMVLPTDVHFSAGWTASSLAVAMAATGAAFVTLGTFRAAVSWRSLGVASVVMGGGVSAMHFMGMAAMSPSVAVAHDPAYVAASTLVGVVASAAALRLALYGTSTAVRRLAGAVAMGVAVAGLHYVAMAGTSFAVPESDLDLSGTALIAGVDRSGLAGAVGVITLLLLVLGIAAATADRTMTRRSAEDADLIAAERDYSRMLLESSPDGVIGFDRDLAVTVWNPAQAAISGIPAAEAVGRRLDEVLWRISDSATLRGARRALLGQSEAIDDSHTYEDGRTVNWSASFAPLVAPDGSVRGGLAHVRLTTRIRQLEDTLRQSQKMEAMGQLTSGIVHDFNNILQIVGSSITLLQRGRSVDVVTAGMQDAIDRGRALTQQLLGFSRKRSLNPVPLRPGEHVAGLSRMLASSMRNGARLRVAAPSSRWTAEVDQNELDIAILNLCVNAADATRNGNVTVDVADVTVPPGSFEKAEPGDYVRISVRDDGQGMPPEVASKVFEPFFTTKESGTGLGLSQVYGFAKRSGGVVEVHTFPEVGTTVSVLLPRARETSAPEAA